MSEADPPACQLYLITPPVIDDLSAFAAMLESALDAAPVACVQLRLKEVDDAAILAAGRVLGPLVQARQVAFIVNDRPDLAVRLQADGVHVGQSDASLAQAREMVGKDQIVGVTCHASRHLAMEAAEQGADYVAFGAFYPTSTKETVHRASPDLLTWWQELAQIPCVAIGGIGIAQAGELARAGADFLAVSSAVWTHPQGPAAAVRAFDAILRSTDQD